MRRNNLACILGVLLRPGQRLQYVNISLTDVLRTPSPDLFHDCHAGGAVRSSRKEPEATKTGAASTRRASIQGHPRRPAHIDRVSSPLSTEGLSAFLARIFQTALGICFHLMASRDMRQMMKVKSWVNQRGLQVVLPGGRTTCWMADAKLKPRLLLGEIRAHAPHLCPPWLGYGHRPRTTACRRLPPWHGVLTWVLREEGLHQGFSRGIMHCQITRVCFFLADQASFVESLIFLHPFGHPF